MELMPCLARRVKPTALLRALRASVVNSPLIHHGGTEHTEANSDFGSTFVYDLNDDMSEPISNYEEERRQKRDKLREIGVDPYGGRETGLRSLLEIKSSYTPEMGHDGGPIVKAAGRIMLKRDMGKLSFLTLRDESGDLQVALDKKRLDETAWQVNGLLDLGDQIVVEGNLGKTNKGETTIWAKGVKLAAKSLLPPPGKWDGLSDVELRYRQRYVDLWANPDVMQLMKKRMLIIDEIRAYLRDRGFLEVETPMMQTLAGGAAARPFVTHHHALDIPLYLRIAPELYLKRLLVGGFSKVFEINRNFRNEGISPKHNPEFTMLEAYEAFGSWETMADLVEGMICHVAEKLFGGLKIVHHGGTEAQREINLERPWRRVKMVDLVEDVTPWKFNKEPLQFSGAMETIVGSYKQRIHDETYKSFMALENSAAISPDHYTEMAREKSEVLAQRWKGVLMKLSAAEQLVEVYEKLVESNLKHPTFVTHVPSVIIPLARKNREDSYFADVYELAINGQEISPGYSELNDPDVQAANFAHQVGDEAEKQKTDEDFLTALKYGMPPAGGMGLGIDRLVMMLTGAQSIRDVILFPLMRPT